MNFHKYATKHFFYKADLSALERLEKWAYLKTLTSQEKWKDSDCINMLGALGAKDPKKEFRNWTSRRVIVPTLKADYYMFGNEMLQNYLAAKHLNYVRMYDELIDNCLDQPWAAILCHLIWIEDEKNSKDVLKALVRIIPGSDGELSTAHLRRSKEFLRIYYEELPIDSRIWLESALDRSINFIPPQTKRQVNTFRIHLSVISDKLILRGISNTGSLQSPVEVSSPYPPDTIRAIFRVFNDEMAFFDAMDEANLESAGLLYEGKPIADFDRIVGKRLYDSIFSTNNAFAEFIVARTNDEPVILKLFFDPDDVPLTQFPWETMFDGNIPLVIPDNEVYLARSILLSTVTSNVTVEKDELFTPLKVLSLHPRPKKFAPLPMGEKTTLKQLSQYEWFYWKELPPQWDYFKDFMLKNNGEFNVLHFDGHGSFGKYCGDDCQTLNDPMATECKNCKQNIIDITPTGYLSFEKDNQERDMVSVMDLKVLLANQGVKLCVISACKSATFEGISAFNGIAPGLIQAGLYAVVGMQGSPIAGSAAKFVSRFYRSLAEGFPVYRAVNLGRLDIFRDKPPCWFMPVLYLRN